MCAFKHIVDMNKQQYRGAESGSQNITIESLTGSGSIETGGSAYTEIGGETYPYQYHRQQYPCQTVEPPVRL